MADPEVIARMHTDIDAHRQNGRTATAHAIEMEMAAYTAGGLIPAAYAPPPEPVVVVPDVAPEPAAAVEGPVSPETYEVQTKTELHDEAANRDLAVGGTKDDLMDRLEADDRAHDAEVAAATEPEPPTYEDWAKADLAAECEKRGLPTSGTKADLIDRLEDDDDAKNGQTPE